MIPNSSWPWVPLSEIVVDTQYGTAEKANDNGQGLPILRMNNITYSGAIDLSSLKHIELDETDHDRYTVRRGDLLFNRTNSPELVGKLGVWNSDESFAYAGYLVRIRLDQRVASPAFIAAYFNTPEMKAQLRTRAKPSINMSNISASEVLKFRVPLPPLSDQGRIAAILNHAERLRSRRNDCLAHLGALLQSRFLELFGDPVGNSKKLATRLIGDIGQVVTGNTPSRSRPEYYGNEIEWIKSDNINTPYDYLTTASEWLSPEGKRIARTAPPKSILVTCIAGSPECIGNSAICDRHVAFNQQINALIPDHGDHRFLYVQMVVGKRMFREASTAAMKGMISKSRFEQIPLLFPPLETQLSFGRFFDEIHQLKRRQQTSMEKFDALFLSLQHRAFRGEL